FPKLVKFGFTLVFQVVISDETPPQIQREDSEDKPFDRVEDIEPGNFAFFGLRGDRNIFDCLAGYNMLGTIDGKALGYDISGVERLVPQVNQFSGGQHLGALGFNEVVRVGSWPFAWDQTALDLHGFV